MNERKGSELLCDVTKRSGSVDGKQMVELGLDKSPEPPHVR